MESLIIRPSDDSEGTLDPAEREVLWDELQEVSGYSTSRYCCLRSLKDVSFPDTRSGSFDLVEEAAGTECDRIVVIDFGDTFTFVYVLSKDEAQESTGLTEWTKVAARRLRRLGMTHQGRRHRRSRQQTKPTKLIKPTSRRMSKRAERWTTSRRTVTPTSHQLAMWTRMQTL